MTEENTPKQGWQPGDAQEEANIKPVANVKVEIDVQETPAQESASSAEPKVAPQMEAPQQPPAQTVPSNSVNPSAVVYEKGCCGAAWEDIRNTKGWFGKVCLMALVEFIPILNWVNRGFAMRWSRELFLGKVQSMPQKLFCKRAFSNGAMSFIVGLVAGIAGWAGSFIMAFVPIVGALASIAFALFIAILVNFCYVRMAIFDELGEGFAIGKAFGCLKRDFGKALCVEFVPGIVLGCIIMCIIGVMTGIFFLVGGFSIFAQLNDLIAQYSSYRAFEYAVENDLQLQWKILSIVLTNLAASIPFMLIGWFFVNVCSMISMLIKMRAAGHFVTRYCSEWEDEPKFQVVLQCEEK